MFLPNGPLYMILLYAANVIAFVLLENRITKIIELTFAINLHIFPLLNIVYESIDIFVFYHCHFPFHCVFADG